MKPLLKFLKFLGKALLVILVALNLFIIFTGRFYLYKGVWNTYLKGRSGPAIDEYQIFHNRKVESGQPQEWPVGSDYNRKKISDAHRQDFERMKTIAYLVIKDDSIRYEEYWDGFSDTSHTNSFSVAKTIVSVLTGCAIAEGKIKSVDQPVGDFLPEYRSAESAGLTVRHLLTMSSAIDWDENYANPLAYPAQAYYGTDLKKLNAKYKVAGPCGKNFEYRSGNTQVLGFLLEQATGMSLSRYASEKLWKPLGAKHPAYWSLDHENGHEKAYCCFNSNVRDFARIGQLYLDSGRWKGKQIVPEDYVLESIKPAPLVCDGQPNKKYGYSWWLLPDYLPAGKTGKGYDIFYARGILGQYVIQVPDKNMVIVRLGAKRELGRLEHPQDLFWYIDAALEMYSE
ncbi:MAG: serine hydrolase [Bacteroidota bacterium]